MSRKTENKSIAGHVHASHPAIAKRLRRASGHLTHVIEMIDGQQSCVDIAQQLHAVERAIANAKRVLIQEHIDHCLEDSLKDPDTDRSVSLAEFREIAKYL